MAKKPTLLPPDRVIRTICVVLPDLGFMQVRPFLQADISGWLIHPPGSAIFILAGMRHLFFRKGRIGVHVSYAANTQGKDWKGIFVIEFFALVSSSRQEQFGKVEFFLDEPNPGLAVRVSQNIEFDQNRPKRAAIVRLMRLHHDIASALVRGVKV